MITVKIGQDERPLDAADEQWINQQINRRRDDGQTVCVQLKIDEGDVNLVLSTPGCPRGGGAPRNLTPREADLIDLWERRGLGQADFSAGSVVAFLHQLKHRL